MVKSCGLEVSKCREQSLKYRRLFFKVLIPTEGCKKATLISAVNIHFFIRSLLIVSHLPRDLSRLVLMASRKSVVLT